MPAMNGTGPQGAGSLTGRGLGYCNKSDATAPFWGRGGGNGMNRRNNFSRGFRQRGFYTAPEVTPEQQKDMLKQQKAFFENELSNIDKQIENL